MCVKNHTMKGKIVNNSKIIKLMSCVSLSSSATLLISDGF